jgi:HAD superfamily hydrolase (TIGR01509 family)
MRVWFTVAVIRALIFDCDGVLVDNEPGHHRALNEALREEGISLDAAGFREVVGRPDRDTIIWLMEKAGKPVDLDRVTELCRRKAEAFARSVAAGLPPVPGVVDFVRKGAALYPVAVASGGIRVEVQAIIAQLGITDCVRVLVTAEDTPRGKPDPAPFLLALERLNAAGAGGETPIAAGECLVFEDSVHGIAAARAAGMRSVGLTTLLPADDLVDADLVAPHFRALDLTRVVRQFHRRMPG